MFYEPPKVCCCQARRFILIFSVMSFIVCMWQLIDEEDPVSKVVGVFCGVLEVVLFYGVVMNVSQYLKISMYISLIHLTFDFGTILLSPVYIASETASGYESNDTYSVFQIILAPDTEKRDRFIAGLLTGYSVEFLSTISVFLGILKFVLINRCYVYTKMMEDAVFMRRNNDFDLKKF